MTSPSERSSPAVLEGKGRRRILKQIFSLNLLLVFVPVAVVLWLQGVHGLWLFAAAAVAIVPLAAWMGHATEHLASRVGEGLGGFLNATFGNAAEMIIAIAALRHGHVEVVKSSLIGSVIGNLLFVFGLSMLVGGARRPRQTFDRTAAGAGVSMMVVSVVAFVIPSIFHGALTGKAPTPEEARHIEQRLAVDIAVVLLLTYGLSLLFAFKTHRQHYSVAEALEKESPGDRPHLWSVPVSLGVLLGATAVIAFMSELLVHELDGASKALGLSQTFVGIFLVAVIGNAAEHSTAVLVAHKDRMDLAMGVAVGACQQIALFVAPLLVLLSYLFEERARLDFLYSDLEVITVSLSVFLFATVAGDGESNWYEGVLFLAVYAIFGIGFFLLPS